MVSTAPSLSEQGPNIEAADGIVRYSMDMLAADPSLILGHPAPGGHYFYVDQLHQIKPGCRIVYSTMAEHDPATVKKELAQLFEAQKQREKYPVNSELWMTWDAKCNTLGLSLKTFFEGKRRIKSLRTVVHTEVKQRPGETPIYLVVCNKPFDLGHWPRPLGGVLRYLGTETDLADEAKTEQFHNALKGHYGSDWESDLKAYGHHSFGTLLGGR